MEKHVLQWHITHKCNLRCKHCYQDDYTEDLEITELKDIFYQYLDFLKENNYKGHINFTGGEPLAIDSLLKLYSLMKLCDENNITYGILTNGTLLNESMVLKLKEFKNLKFIQMSLEGCRKTTDNIRGKNVYKDVMKAVKRLNRAGIQTMISFTVHESNYREIRKLIWSCRIHGVKRFWTDRFIPIGGIDKYNSDIKVISTKNYMRVIKIIGQEHKLNWLGMKVHTNRALQFMSGCGEFYECSAGDKLLTILADGTLLPCRRLPIKLGDLTEEKLNRIVKRNKKLQELKNKEHESECNSCHLYRVCKGGAKCLTYAVTGELNKKDVNCPFN